MIMLPCYSKQLEGPHHNGPKNIKFVAVTSEKKVVLLSLHISSSDPTTFPLNKGTRMSTVEAKRLTYSSKEPCTHLEGDCFFK